jgi:acetyl esterase
MPNTENGHVLTSQGHETPIMERFSFRTYREFVFKETSAGELKASVYYPFDWKEGDRRPGVLFFFGGGFRVGTRHQFERQAAYLASRGMVVASADYRVSVYHKTQLNECFEDAFSAIRWFRANSRKLGVDPTRVAAGGGSAGGTLAAALASLSGFDTQGEDSSVSARPDALVLFNPALGLFRPLSSVTGASEEEVNERRERLAQQGVTPDDGARFSSLDNLQPGLPPAYIWFGTDDRLLVPARGYIEKAESLGAEITLQLAQDADHGYFNDYEEFFTSSLRMVDSFLSANGFLTGGLRT